MCFHRVSIWKERFYLSTHEFFTSRNAVFIENDFIFLAAAKLVPPPLLDHNFGENNWVIVGLRSSLDQPVARRSASRSGP